MLDLLPDSAAIEGGELSQKRWQCRQPTVVDEHVGAPELTSILQRPRGDPPTRAGRMAITVSESSPRWPSDIDSISSWTPPAWTTPRTIRL